MCIHRHYQEPESTLALVHPYNVTHSVIYIYIYIYIYMCVCVCVCIYMYT